MLEHMNSQEYFESQGYEIPICTIHVFGFKIEHSISGHELWIPMPPFIIYWN